MDPTLSLRMKPRAPARACSPCSSTRLGRRPRKATSMPRASRAEPPASCSAIALAPSSSRSTNDVAEAGDRSVIGACDFHGRIDAYDDVGRPRLVGYCARPCFARDRLGMLRDGRAAYRVEYAGRRSTHHVMTLIEFLARLAALVAALRYRLVRCQSAHRTAGGPKPAHGAPFRRACCRFTFHRSALYDLRRHEKIASRDDGAATRNVNALPRRASNRAARLGRGPAGRSLGGRDTRV